MTAPQITEQPHRGRSSGVALLIWGVLLNTAALVGWTIGGVAAPASLTQTISFVTSVFLQTGAIACLLGATLVGINGLRRKVRPLVRPLVSALALPIAFIIWMPMVVVVWALVT